MIPSGDSIGLLLGIAWIIARAGVHRSLAVIGEAPDREEVEQWLRRRGAKVPSEHGPPA
ncbi:MAG: hypothetical protein ABI910_17535 [Gemmatimonadota bacterium]